MIQKKICMLGSFAVGKTSLVRRYVQSIFDEKYLTTIGVKIDKKVVDVKGQLVTLMLWDLEGEDDFSIIKTSYLRGMSGYFVVADGTRKETVKKALDIHKRVRQQMGGELPFYLLVNKHDLLSIWEINMEVLANLESGGIPVRLTSVKDGQGVDDSFEELAAAMLASCIGAKEAHDV